AAHGHILTNTAVWSPDSRRLVYDVRPDPAGDVFDGTRIETVDVETGAVRVLYESRHGAKCGVATYHPGENKVVFIHGPEHPAPTRSSGRSRKAGSASAGISNRTAPGSGAPWCFKGTSSTRAAERCRRCSWSISRTTSPCRRTGRSKGRPRAAPGRRAERCSG